MLSWTIKLTSFMYAYYSITSLKVLVTEFDVQVTVRRDKLL